MLDPNLSGVGRERGECVIESQASLRPLATDGDELIGNDD